MYTVHVLDCIRPMYLLNFCHRLSHFYIQILLSKTNQKKKKIPEYKNNVKYCKCNIFPQPTIIMIIIMYEQMVPEFSLSSSSSHSSTLTPTCTVVSTESPYMDIRNLIHDQLI
jgi:hypothetical protein